MTYGGTLFAAYWAQHQEQLPPDDEVWYWAPEQVTLYSQTGVVSHTFANGKGVVKFNAPVTTVGQTFRFVTTITEIRLPECVTSIGNAAFVNGQFTKINIDNVVTIGSSFQNCTKLVLDKLPDKLTTIGDSAFSNCSSLRVTELPNTVTSVGDSAFRLSSAAFTKLPEYLETIGNNAFQSSLCAFSEIPASVKSIGRNAFTSLHMPVLTFLGTPQSLDAGTFNQLSTIQTIRVPWSEGEVANAPWGATNATIWYNHNT